MNDYIMNEPYTQEDPPMQIYTLNSKYTFEKSSCLTYDELFSYIGTGKNTKAPEVLQTIYECDFKCEDNGKHSYATGKLIVKIPPNNIYVTLGSIERMIKSHTHIKHWYALPLYKRRIGNLDELFSSSRNHGQIPGFLIYKLFTKEEIKNGITVRETKLDYPIFLYNESKHLHQIIGSEVTIPFVNGIIDHLLN